MSHLLIFWVCQTFHSVEFKEELGEKFLHGASSRARSCCFNIVYVQPTCKQKTTMDVNYSNGFSDRWKWFGALVNTSLVEIISPIAVDSQINFLIFLFTCIN
jgi:hypothetical protein